MCRIEESQAVLFLDCIEKQYVLNFMINGSKMRLVLFAKCLYVHQKVILSQTVYLKVGIRKFVLYVTNIWVLFWIGNYPGNLISMPVLLRQCLLSTYARKQ